MTPKMNKRFAPEGGASIGRSPVSGNTTEEGGVLRGGGGGRMRPVGVAVGARMGVAVGVLAGGGGGWMMPVEVAVGVGEGGITVGVAVLVGGIGVAVGGTGVSVGGTGVSVGSSVGVRVMPIGAFGTLAEADCCCTPKTMTSDDKRIRANRMGR